jgi:hypothetical protein
LVSFDSVSLKSDWLVEAIFLVVANFRISSSFFNEVFCNFWFSSLCNFLSTSAHPSGCQAKLAAAVPPTTTTDPASSSRYYSQHFPARKTWQSTNWDAWLSLGNSS